ncbi:MAG TPA: hypothetical protein VG144_08905 [Gaiellaceae bacterium]|nr:hypothetical protein [Gaiellaceae bacterium]
MRRVALVVAMALVLPGCGGDDEAVPTQPTTTQRAIVQCGGPAVKPDLPRDFPAVEGVTYTKSTSAGPSKIVDGYYEGRLEDAYRKFKTALRAAGYAVIFDEIEAQDSEVAYSGGDLDRSGFVALREDCAQPGRISVHITNRPA